MSALSPHLREQKFGRRVVRFSLKDAIIVSSPDDGGEETATPNQLRYDDGSIADLAIEPANMARSDGDIVTQVYVSSSRRKRSFLGAIVNRSTRERARALPLSKLLRGARVSRSLSWWWSFIFLAIAAIITEYGLFASEISEQLEPLQKAVATPTAPFVELVSGPLAAIFNWLPLSVLGLPNQAFAMFGSLQDHCATSFIAISMMIVVVWARSLRLLSVPFLAVCLFLLKTRLFGYDGAQGAVLVWYAPALALLITIGGINRLRDRARLAMRLSAIGKSLMAQPLSPNLADKLVAAGKTSGEVEAKTPNVPEPVKASEPTSASPAQRATQALAQTETPKPAAKPVQNAPSTEQTPAAPATNNGTPPLAPKPDGDDLPDPPLAPPRRRRSRR